MLACMSNLTDTPKWCEKVLSDAFTELWKSKMLSEHAEMSSGMVDWVCCVREPIHQRLISRFCASMSFER